MNQERYVSIFQNLRRQGEYEPLLNLHLNETTGPIFIGVLLDLYDFSQQTTEDEKVEARIKQIYETYQWLETARILSKPALSTLTSAILAEIEKLKSVA